MWTSAAVSEAGVRRGWLELGGGVEERGFGGACGSIFISSCHRPDTLMNGSV